MGLLLIKIYSSSYEKKESKNKNDNKLQEFQKEENGISLPSIQEGVKLQNILKLTSLCFLSTKSSLKVLHRNSIKQTSFCPNPNSLHHELNSLISPTNLYSASLFQFMAPPLVTQARTHGTADRCMTDNSDSEYSHNAQTYARHSFD